MDLIDLLEQKRQEYGESIPRFAERMAVSGAAWEHVLIGVRELGTERLGKIRLAFPDLGDAIAEYEIDAVSAEDAELIISRRAGEAA